MEKESIVFNNISFHRYPESRKKELANYYIGVIKRKKIRLHRYVWEYHNGAIPKGMIVHHKDHNPLNNDISNLQTMYIAEHNKHHNDIYCFARTEEGKRHIESIRPLTKEWHASKEGMAWHAEHAKKFNFGHQDYGVANCGYCKKEYAKKASFANFCSNNCKSRYRFYSGIDNITTNCLWCSKEFVRNKYQKRNFCNKSCSAKSHWAKSREHGVELEKLLLVNTN